MPCLGRVLSECGVWWVQDYLPVSEVEARPATPRRRPSLDFMTPVIRTTPKMASPALMRSPFMVGRDRSGSLSYEGGPGLSTSLPRHAAYMPRTGAGTMPQPRNYGAVEEGGLPARAGSLNRPVFGKATRPSGVDFADDGEAAARTSQPSSANYPVWEQGAFTDCGCARDLPCRGVAMKCGPWTEVCV